MSLHNIIGLIGVMLVLLAFFLLQVGRLPAKKPLYSWLNLVGAIAIIYSLFFDFNLPSFLMEASWLSISIVGLWRLKKRNETSE